MKNKHCKVANICGLILLLMICPCSKSLNANINNLKQNTPNLDSLNVTKELFVKNYFPKLDLNKAYSSHKSGCNYINCKEPFGKCSPTEKNLCYCNNGFVHAPHITKNTLEFCTYPQKLQYISFLLEFFLPFGTGHFYSYRYMLGYLKMFLFICTLLILTYGNKQPNDYDNTQLKNQDSLLNILGYFTICIFCCVHFSDIFMIGINKYQDGNGIPLKIF